MTTNNHLWKDLVPYLYWGNNSADTTTRKQRVSKAFAGMIAGNFKSAVEKALDIMEEAGY